MRYSVRAATPEDAEQLIAVLEEVASERVYTAITKPWSAAEQRRHMTAFSLRERIHVAVSDRQTVVGYQILELWAPSIASMAHVGQIGTFVAAAWRGNGIGYSLFQNTRGFACANGYAKFVIQVRASNLLAQNFYKRVGFIECGRLSRQFRTASEEDDEIIMEYFLDSPC